MCTELCGASIGEEEHEKQMGELGSGDGEQLDKNMWAPEEEEDQQNVSTSLLPGMTGRAPCDLK